MIGEQLLHYKVLDKLGEGGMGEVYLAEDSKLKRRVALKLLPEALSRDPVRLKRFGREAEALAALNHPNIVTVYAIEECDGRHFMTMELVEGEALAELVGEGGIELDGFFAIAVPLAGALAAAHEKGITHRDLKPGNIMVSAAGQVKVLDFGLAKREPDGGAAELAGAPTETLTREGHIPGTILYMSPEQLSGGRVDHRSDIFALGVILYELATGSHVFQRGSSAETVSSILRDEPRPVTELKAGLPRHLGRILRHCLAKDPARRYQSALDLRNDLQDLEEELAAGKLSESRAPPPPVKATWRPRRRLAVTAAVLLVGLVLVVATLLLRRAGPAFATPGAIAVLPFANLTGDPNQDYVGEGISAGLITQLAEVAGIRVVGRSQTWAYRGKDLSPRELGAELGVEALLEGEVQRAQEELRADVKLTDTRSGLVLWSESISASGERVFSLQSEIARRLTGYLSIPLTFKERRRLARNPTESLRAYDFYLQGQQYLEDLESAHSADFAADILRQAIRIDPDFALAHVGLSEALWRKYQREKKPADLEEAEQKARTALEIDPDLAAAQVALARVYRSTGRHAESIAELRQVLARHPKPDEAQRELAASYEQIGDAEGAERCLRAAVALGADYWFNWNELGTFLALAGRSSEARQAYERAVAVAPAQIVWPLENLGTLLLYEGEFEAAIETYERLPRPLDAVQASNLATAYYFGGQISRSAEYFAQAVRLDPGNPELRRNYGDVLQRVGQESEAGLQYEEAVALVDQELALNPMNQPLQTKRAMYAAKAGDCAAALPQARELWTNLPESAHTAHELAYVFALCDRSAEALEAIGAAIRLGIAPELIRQEDEFLSLRDDPEFARVTGQAAPGSS